MKQLQVHIRELFESRVPIHLLFISLFILLFCLPPLVGGLPAPILFKVGLYGLYFLTCIYMGRFGCRQWLLKSRFHSFILYALLTMLCLFSVGTVGAWLLSKTTVLVMLLTVSFVVVLFFSLGVFLSLSRSTLLRQIREAHQMQQQKESELHLLRSHVSPHFLFNTLNSLYGLSLREQDKVPPLLLKLSDLLSYSLYETDQLFVPLLKELEYIENYVAFEKLRTGERLSLDLNIDKSRVENIRLAPMLLIVFIENAFKHSKNSYEKQFVVQVDFQVRRDTIVFKVRNSCGKQASTGETSRSGLGLSLTRKRLELIYPGKHSLTTRSENGYYEANLQIQVK